MVSLQIRWYEIVVFIGAVGVVIILGAQQVLTETDPSEKWCDAFANSPDAITTINPEIEGFCEFNYTESKWHLNRTAYDNWQFKEKFGVDR